MNLLSRMGVSALSVIVLSGAAFAGPLGATSVSGQGFEPISQSGAASDLLGHLVWAPKQPDTLMHTDVPDLPEGRVPQVPDLVSNHQSQQQGGAVGHLAPGKQVIHQLDDALAEIRKIIDETMSLSGPKGSEPARVHTDVPDLPGIELPSVSNDPFRKPGWGDLSDVISAPPRPQLERSTIPVPSTVLLFGITGIAAARRRR